MNVPTARALLALIALAIAGTLVYLGWRLAPLVLL